MWWDMANGGGLGILSMGVIIIIIIINQTFQKRSLMLTLGSVC